MTKKPYAIGSAHWPGLSKLIEESGEVAQVAGKILGTGGAALHWDGSNLRDRLEEKLGDLIAAIAFVVEKCELDRARVDARATTKANLFHAWHENEPELPGVIRPDMKPQSKA